MIYALFKVIDLIFSMYIDILIAKVVFSWLYTFHVINIRNRFVAMIGHFLHRMTEPVLGYVRSFLPVWGGIDFSPLVVFLVIYFVRIFMWRAYSSSFL